VRCGLHEGLRQLILVPLQALMQLVRATRVAMLIATHNMELANRMDRRVSLADGKVVELD